ncbi:nucleic acid-binding protein [Xylaria intraflava]|nr:nucleic acid-binding protein [Xylaria intraflava]
MSFLTRRLTSAAFSPRLLGSSRTFSASARRDIAKITLVGSLAATPEVRPTSTGKDIIEYSVGSSDGKADNRHTSWFRVATFVEDGPRREYLTSLPKGTIVYVEGDVVMRSYTDGEGKARSATSIYQKSLEVLRRGTPAE